MSQLIARPVSLAVALAVAAPTIASADPVDDGSTWSQEIIRRPLTLGAGMLESRMQLDVLASTFNSTTTRSDVLVGGGTYGITNQIEAGVDYSLFVDPSPDSAEGLLAVHAAYRIASSPRTAAAIDVQLSDYLPTATTSMQAGLALRYRLSDAFALYTPGYQVAVGLGGVSGASLALPIGAALQLGPMLYAMAQTTLATFDLEHATATAISGQSIPLELGAFVSPSRQLDIGVEALGDIAHFGEAFTVALVVRAYML